MIKEGQDFAASGCALTLCFDGSVYTGRLLLLDSSLPRPLDADGKLDLFGSNFRAECN